MTSPLAMIAAGGLLLIAGASLAQGAPAPGAESCRLEDLRTRLDGTGQGARIILSEPGNKLLAEGILWHPQGKWFLVSGRQGIFRYSPDGDFVGKWGATPAGWAVAGLAYDPAREAVWAIATATAAVPDSAGRSRAVGMSLATGAKLAEHDLPGIDRWYGDLAVADDGTVFVGIGRYEGILRLKQGSGKLERLALRGEVRGPQGMFVTPDGSALIVADYPGGLKRVDLSSLAVRPVDTPQAESLRGVDGVIGSTGRWLAVQNGSKPFRILALRPDRSGRRIVAVSGVDDAWWSALGDCGIEPTLAARHGKHAYIVARTLLPPGAPAGGRTLVVRVPL